MSRSIPKPFLIAKDDAGAFRLTLRQVRYNSQHYPIVTSALQPESFESAHAARAFAKQHHGAVPGDFAAK
ncbi:hypothetical protein K7957_01780 [Sphingomonas yunnanensis]|uniref:hypothetical protein n=1 Tax=Sphingomonas yunnanensis TaxID=310400 RepID=UPI001CA5FBD4|nr:hypothetical protein [Sphingomonas yunnanensis]MBY9061661.1 hypothetical protein [Sphingomonas yunnanensis]